MNNNVFKISENVSWKEMDDLIVVVDTNTGAYYSLNTTASNIWKNIVGGKSIHNVESIISGKYEVKEEKMKEDVSKCIKEWVVEGLIFQESSKYQA